MKINLLVIILLLGGTVFAADNVLNISGIYPSSAFPGETVIIKGHGFTLSNPQVVWAANGNNGDCPGFIEFNGARGDVQLWQDDLILVRVPEHGNSGPVQVTLVSGISAGSNHFEVMDPDLEEQENVRRYAFEEREGMTMGDDWAFNRGGLYPSPWYFYQGYRPRYQSGLYPRGNRWGGSGLWNRDGGMDFFMTSGPLLRFCGLHTGLEQFVFFPTNFYNDFSTRYDWWNQSLDQNYAGYQTESGRRKYRFEEK
jgi:hypothetical protein